MCLLISECSLIHFKEISGDSIPINLLFLADPLEAKIKCYLRDATCFGAFDNNDLVGACVTNFNIAGELELFNIATLSSFQRKGVGSKLLELVINKSAIRNVNKLVLGTGTFGHQLAFYQRAGFRVEAVVKDFFTDNYDEPIYENGIKHHDMLRLTINV